jgi:hypothetical protein
MQTLERTAVNGSGQMISPDVAATAEVLRSLYLPHECRHLVELLLTGAAASPGESGHRPPATNAGGETPALPAIQDELFLDLVESRLAEAPTPVTQVRRMRDLRDDLQVQVWFLDALQDRLRQTRAGSDAPDPGSTEGVPDSRELAPGRPAREEMAELLRCERARYAPDRELGVSRAIQEQLQYG